MPVIDAFPLQWPAGKPRTPPFRIQKSAFSPGNRPTEVANIQSEIRRLGGRNIVVSTNIRLRGDGMPFARDRAPTDAGVAIYFDYHGPKCFACDRWRTVEENLRAIFKSIEAIRGLERWGSKDFVDAAFTGFAALMAPDAKRPWRELLGIEPDAAVTAADIEAAWRTVAKNVHPDRPGGSHDAMAAVNEAKDRALREIADE